MVQTDPNGVELHDLPSEPGRRRPIDKNGVESTVPVSPRSSITAREPATTFTHYILWPLVLFVLYAALALFPWIALCVLSRRPIRGEKSYFADDPENSRPEYWYRMSEKYFRAAQIVQPIAVVVTIPVTTAICSAAWAVYMQSGPLRKSLTLKQSMALADAGWIYPRVLVKFTTLGSLPLYTAFTLTLIGSLAQVLQNVFVGQEATLATQGGSYFYKSIQVNDIPGLLNETRAADKYRANVDGGELISQLRGLMESPYTSEDDRNCWGLPETPYEDRYNDDKAWGNIYAPIASNFSIGAYSARQYAPRMNSSVEYVSISGSEYKEKCRKEEVAGGFYADYEYASDTKPLKFEACMPIDFRVSPWKPTRDRQDLIEELYIGTNVFGYSRADDGMDYWKLTSDTSLGYFELPNKYNGYLTGELLDKDPFENDKTQLYENDLKSRTGYKRAVSNTTQTLNDTLLFERNRGPLASVALALFGQFSFIESRMSNPSMFVFPSNHLLDSRGYSISDSRFGCPYKAPFAFWVEARCYVSNSDREDEPPAITQVKEFLGHFRLKQESLMVAFNHALYMANKIWLGGSEEYWGLRPGGLKISHDRGIPITKPKMSRAGTIVVSIFLGAHLLGLMILSVYVALMKPWSETLGAEVMLKMGMVYSDMLVRSETDYQWKRTLNELPGFIGDDRPNDQVGRLRFGAVDNLSRMPDRKFEVLR